MICAASVAVHAADLAPDLIHAVVALAPASFVFSANYTGQAAIKYDAINN
jgi:hypothetical protein